jgi:hypothetical protein
MLQRWRVIAPIIIRSQASAVLFLGVFPAALCLIPLAHALGGARNSDFYTFWLAGHSALHFDSPYPLLSSLPAVANPRTFAPFVYPMPAAFGLIPFAVLPFAVAATLFLALTFGAIVLALRLLDVRDWRCYGAVLGSVPVFAATVIGAFSPLLLLGVAAAWRYRDHVRRVAPIVAALAVAKLFLWPIWLWLVYTRRFAAAAAAAVLGAVATFGAWALVGFAGLHDYPKLLSRLTELVGTKSYSPYAVLRSDGLGPRPAQALVTLFAVALLAAAAARFRTVRSDERSFVATLGIALFLSPVLWPHYLILMYVPIALARPKFSAWWLLPSLLWFDGSGWSGGEPARIVPVLCLTAVAFSLVLRERT